MEEVYREIDQNSDRYLSELFSLLKQPSVSSQGLGIDDCALLLAKMMEEVGIHCKILTMGNEKKAPLIYGEILSPTANKTVLIYGHFDVQPTDPIEEWESPPFEPTVRNGRIYARGVSDNKGQLFAHIKAVEAILKLKKKLPVNLKFMFDSEEEIGSPSLENFCISNKELFSADVAYNSDGPQHISGRPVLVFGNRGNCYVEITHQEAIRDLHSGQFGPAVPNPNERMINLLRTLIGPDGRVLIEGFYDNIIPPTAAEKEAIAKIPHDEESLLKSLGLKSFTGSRDIGFWEKIMFHPTFNICGYNSGYGGEGAKTVIPCKTRVKIDMRLVKNQNPKDIFSKFKRHMEKYGFGDLEPKLLMSYNPAKTPLDHPAGKRVADAVKKVYKLDPIVYPTIGGSNPGGIISDSLGIPLMKVPYGNHDMYGHAPNENLSIEFLYKGIKCSATVFYELGKLE